MLFCLPIVFLSFCCISHSENETYNILNGSLMNAESLRTGPRQSNIRSLHRMKAGKMGDHSHAHAAGDQTATKVEEKKLRKITFKGWDAARSRGYDVVSNCPFDPQGASLSIVDPARPFSTSQTVKHRHDSLPTYHPGKRMIIQNNYLGAHIGTGVNIRRVHTSYLNNPIEEIISHDVEDEGDHIEDLEESQRAKTSGSKDINTNKKEKEKEKEKEREVLSLHLICDRKNEPNWNDPRSILATLSNSTSRQFAGKSPHSIFVSGNPKSLQTDSGRSLRSLESRILSVRTEGLSRAM